MGFGVPEAISQIHEHYLFTCNAVREKYILVQFDPEDALVSMEQIGKECIGWGIEFMSDCMFLGLLEMEQLEQTYYIKLKDFYKKSHMYQNFGSVSQTKSNLKQLLLELKIDTVDFCNVAEYFFTESEKVMNKKFLNGQRTGLNRALCRVGKYMAIKEWIDVKKALNQKLSERETRHDELLRFSWIQAEMHL